MSEIIDNRARRVRDLKDIIKKLHSGVAAEEVKSQMQEIVRETDYSEIVAMEQELMAEGMPVEEIQCMCDLHSEVTRDVLVQLAPVAVPPGHPVDTMRRENAALRDVAARMHAVLAEVAGLPPTADASVQLTGLRQAFNELNDVDKHYQRKENAIFSRLETHGVTGPSKVMWAKDDEVRALLKGLGAALSSAGETAAALQDGPSAAARAGLAALEEMIYKEENILLPMCLDMFTAEDWAEIWLASPRHGWCLVEPRKGYRPPEAAIKEAVSLQAGEAVPLPTGNLTLGQLKAMFTTLPVDLTFVDADDRVAFFSEGPDRIFDRSTAILGRLVQHCHPPRSVHIVDRIVGDFRAGRQNVAEFWITFKGRLVHIRYFAVRDEAGKYIGTLEVTQDITRLRALEGERRLLEYDDTPAAPAPPAPPRPARGLSQIAPAPPAAAAPAVPAWLDRTMVRHIIDADSMLATGVHPIGTVRQKSASLGPGEIVRLDSGFRPEPLLTAMTNAGFAVHCLETSPGRHSTFICRL
jgi:DUF438 domain-containing protein